MLALVEFPNITRMVIGDNSFTNTRITPIVCIPESREKLYKDYNNREEIESKKIREIFQRMILY